MFLAPPDDRHVVYEFFAPFAHVPGKYEWCRIRSPTHGVFDTFILLGESTAVPATVYVNATMGEAFLRERYPECVAVRVPPGALRIEESGDGRRVTGTLQPVATPAGKPGPPLPGPVAEARMELAAQPTAIPEAVPYGGSGAPVWGGRFTCWGVDLALHGTASGRIRFHDGRVDEVTGKPCIVTLGSFGRIAPRPVAVPATAPHA